MVKVIYEDNHLLVVEKPVNILSQSDKTNDKDMVNLLKKYVKDKYNKPGNVFIGLVHRLDRPVGGVMVFAKTSKAASRLSEQVRNKTYKDHKEAKNAELSYNLISSKGDLSMVEVDLKTGRSHQIRVQFASRNHPLYGDQRYGQKMNKIGQQLALWSQKIEIVHPTTKEKMEFESLQPNEYPWNIFKQ